MEIITNDQKELAGVMIKPDAIQEGIQEQIINDLILSGFLIRFRYDVQLTAEDVVWIYPEQTKTTGGYRDIVTYLTEDPVILIGLTAVKKNIDNAVEYLHMVKGSKKQKKGIRHKYNKIEITEQDKILKTKAYYRYMTRNYLHVFDSTEIFLRFLKIKNLNC